MAVKGKKLEGVARYYVGQGNPEADWAFVLASEGKAAFSVGFIPDMEKAKERESSRGGGGFFRSPMEFQGQELIEVSQVNVPANSAALQKALGTLMDVGADPDIIHLFKEVNDKLALHVEGQMQIKGAEERLEAMLRKVVREELAQHDSQLAREMRELQEAADAPAIDLQLENLIFGRRA